MQKRLFIHTDGGCIGNPGVGGWAFVVSQDGKELFSSSGYDPETTNNRMEMTAVIEALRYLIDKHDRSIEVELHTDSQYVKNGITTWIKKWKENGWRTASKNPVKNQDLWIRLDELAALREVSWNWVKGHSGDYFNEKCDSLVQQAMRKS
ncbi:MAG: ribonuclease HI [Sphaerochaetaceae bacterium]|jgi:ribonuclease HI